MPRPRGGLGVSFFIFQRTLGACLTCLHPLLFLNVGLLRRAESQLGFKLSVQREAQDCDDDFSEEHSVARTSTSSGEVKKSAVRNVTRGPWKGSARDIAGTVVMFSTKIAMRGLHGGLQEFGPGVRP